MAERAYSTTTNSRPWRDFSAVASAKPSGADSKQKTNPLAELIVSTNPELTGEQVIRFYAARWCVEPAFNAIKNSVGLKQAWLQNKEAHSRWRCILCTAYCVSVLANIFFGEQLKQIMPIPWRYKQPMSAPWAACALRLFFSRFRISIHWNRKLQKITIPDSGSTTV